MWSSLALDLCIVPHSSSKKRDAQDTFEILLGSPPIFPGLKQYSLGKNKKLNYLFFELESDSTIIKFKWSSKGRWTTTSYTAALTPIICKSIIIKRVEILPSISISIVQHEAILHSFSGCHRITNICNMYNLR